MSKQFDLFEVAENVVHNNPYRVTIELDMSAKSWPMVYFKGPTPVVRPELEYFVSEPIFFRVKESVGVYFGFFHVTYFSTSLNRHRFGIKAPEPLVYFQSGVCRFNPDSVEAWGYMSEPLFTNGLV